MKTLTGYENARVITSERKQLPRGGYIVKIMDCSEVTGNKNGKEYSYLDFSFDVADGEYKGHFTAIYQASSDENKKWKGTHRQFIPQESDTYYEDNLARFKTMIVNFEESNPGYHWNWNEKTLKGKLIGIVYGEEEFLTNNGEVITITKPRYFTGIDSIRNGTFKIPQLKKLPEPQMSFGNFTPAPEDEKLPWE